MQKGSGSSKKVGAPGQAEQYKSESGRPGGVRQAKEGKEGYAFQNMKEFKCEIDHQIAKCLDTLDRQGLKFLKETLRASKIFGLNTQQLGATQPLEENISVEDSPPKHKEAPKKIQSLKHNVQIKKVSKPELTKKAQPVQPKNGKAGQPRNDLNDKINKRLDSLNIKTGKKNEQGRKPDEKKQKKEIEIQEEIQEEPEAPEPQKLEKQQPVKQITYNNRSSEPHLPSRPQSRPIRESPIEGAEEESLISKPFHKKTFKRITEQAKPEKPSKEEVQMLHEAELVKSIESPLPPPKKQEVSPPVAQHFNRSGELREMCESKQAVMSQCADESPLQRKAEGSDPYMSNLIAVISRLSPTKRNKLQRILQKLQCSDKYENTSSLVSDLSNNQPYTKPYIPQKQVLLKPADLKDNHSKSRSKLQKVEKATSLKGSFLKKIGSSQTTQNNYLTLNRNKERAEQSKRQSEQNILQKYDNSASQVLEERRERGAPQSIIAQGKPEEGLEGNRSQLGYSNNFSQNESGQKLIKIGKRKNQVTSLVFKILSNCGHSSLVGLSCIQIFNPLGEIIPIDQSNLKQPNPKLLRLFSDNYRGEGWLTSLSGATLALEGIVQQVAGVRIVNWNRSEIEVDRQADLMEIWVNEQLHWRGQVKGGSFKESEVYATNIKVIDRPFEFPDIRKQLSQSALKEELSPKLPSFKPKAEPQEGSLCWLEKEAVERKLREMEEQERKEEKVKKISTIRNTYALSQDEKSAFPSPVKPEPKQEHKAFQFGLSWLNEDPKDKRQEAKFQKESKANLRLHHNDDILLELSKGLESKKRKDDGSLPAIIARKEEGPAPSLSVSKKDEFVVVSRKREESSLRIKEAKKEYMMQKEKEQDLEFEKILQSMEERGKEKEKEKESSRIEKNEEVQKKDPPLENKGKAVANKNFEEFMNDSLFTDKPAPKFEPRAASRPLKIVEENEDYKGPKNAGNNKELDNLIDELNDVVAKESGEEFYMPELPRGQEMTLVLLSNWGHQNFVGLNGVEIFDSEGEQVRPIGVACSLMSSKELYEKLFKQELLTSDEKVQVKFPKGKRVAISLTLPERIEVGGIRVWNYSGHRVHNNMGVRKLHIKLDGSFIFSGEVQQSQGPSEHAHRSCEHLLFTDSPTIIAKINDNDWLSAHSRKEEEERALFKTTLENFHRPLTRNDEEAVKRQAQEVEVERQAVKMPKRLCFEYDPPLLPQGFTLKFVLHSSWGDRFFIGLNGIEVFNEKGENITGRNVSQIRADPSQICKLQGYEGDRRVVGNLINGRNNTVADSNIWLAPLLSDVERIERGRPNVVVVEYGKASRISGINFYNYMKTPQRGVRELQVYLDNFLLYRGYLRKYSPNDGPLHTTLSFTREQALLEAMNYAGYNEDHLEQEVALINEEKVVRASNHPQEASLVRPMTGKISL